MFGETEEEREIIESLQYRKEEEGFDYCFLSYSSWKEVKDEKFQTLRNNYINAQKELDNYIEEMYDRCEGL